MIFNQPAYFAFLAVAVLAFRAVPPRLKPWWLFMTGLVFYAYFSPGFIALLLVEIALVYGLSRLVARRGRAATAWFVIAIVTVVGLLVVYKYGGLLARTAAVSGVGGLPTFEDLRLPLAISFFTFEFVHYLVDARRGELPDHSIGDFLGFALFVPTMVAGPIKRFQGFSEQVRDARVTAEDADAGVRRIIIGLLKKTVFADTITLWTAPLASSGGLAAATRLDIAVALFAYSLRIYLDFSAYSDIAIGSARLFGIKVPENFAWPYLKRDIGSFWRAWHMSLTTWIRDYVYIPLGGNRRGRMRQYVNLVTAMAVSGIWHGAGWNFLGWGLYHGLLLAGHRAWTAALPSLRERLRLKEPSYEGRGGRLRAATGAATSGLLTFSLVTLGWGLFAMPFSRFLEMMARLLGGM